MEAKLETWINGIQKNSTAFTERFSGLDAQGLNWKPDAKTWSIAQNMDHLIQISTSFYPVWDELISGEYKKPFLANFGFWVRLMEKFILKSVQPENPKKIGTFSVWEPAESNIEGDVLARFLAEQERTIGYMKKNKSLLNTGIVIPSPANANILYSLEGAYNIIVVHQQRHFLQAERILQAQA